MKCPRCQHDNPADVTFCGECGARLESLCPACRAANPATNKFCHACGRPLTPASPEAYTPRHLAEKILSSRSAVEGERKLLTVLFCDIAESSRLAEALDPEEMHRVMDRVLRLLAAAVHRYEGTVNQFLGDGLMALFGAPLALEDHALRGVQAALTIQETLSAYSDQLKRERGLELRLRMGLNTGPVVVGRIGDDLRMDYTAVGDTTHLAARMQMAAEPGTILITEATYRRVEGYIRSDALGPVTVKGRSEPVPVYKVTGRRRWRSRFEISAERGLTQLVGRRAELGLLHDCLARVKAGRGQVIGIVGEAGAGKSRLVYEFRRSLETKQFVVLEGHCFPDRQATPFLSILEILSANFHIEDGDNPLQIQAKLRLGVRQLNPELEWIIPFLGELFGLLVEREALNDLEARERAQKTFEAIRALTLVAAASRPQVLIFEDLNWIDKASEDYLLKFATESVAGAPVLVVTTHRPDYAVRWAHDPHYTQIALDVLSEAETEEMLQGVLQARELPPTLSSLIWQKADGNPLFIEEIAQSLLERRIVVRQNGRIAWAGPPLVELPGTVLDIIRARIDRLPEPVKRTLLTAAVIGRRFGRGLLARLAETSQTVTAHLKTLKQLGIVYETQLLPDVEYAFRHAVIQEVAYDSLLLQRRTELHGAIGATLEELYADRLEEHAAVLAHHYGRSESLEKAVGYSLLAGDRAVRLYANAEARTYYEQALSIARTLPASPRAQQAQVDSALKLATVAMTRQDLERARQGLEWARPVAEALPDESRLARVLYWLGRIHYVAWDLHAAIEYAQQSLAIADRLGDDALKAPPVNLMGRAWQTLDIAKSAELMERSVEQMRRLGNKTEEATAAGIAAMELGLLGEFERAVRYADHAVTLAQEIQNPFAEAAAFQLRGHVRDQRGEWAGAIQDYERATSIAQRVGDLFRVYLVKFWEGRAHAMAGAPDRGRAMLEESLAMADRIGTRFGLVGQKSWLAACLLELGELEAVPSLLAEAVQLAEEAGERWARALAYRTLGEASLHREPAAPEKAEPAMLEAIRSLRELGAKPELARTLLSYAGLLTRRNEPEKAREHLAQAIGMFQEMGMAWDLERARHTLPDA
jgi:class 3 adenylate cyclase/tetratricopeptide (TPR) repeat protein